MVECKSLLNSDCAIVLSSYVGIIRKLLSYIHGGKEFIKNILFTCDFVFSEDVRSANIVAKENDTHCLVVDRE